MRFRRSMWQYAVGTPNIADAYLFTTYLHESLRTKTLSNDGPLVRDLEATIGKRQGTECVAVANATTGLELLLYATGVIGKTVVMPSFTFIATAHAVHRLGNTIRFMDIMPETMSIIPSELENLDFDAIVACNLFGMAGENEVLERLAAVRGVPLIFDSAHAMGMSIWTSDDRLRPIGSFGTAEVFSLHATKIIQGFEGGVISTRDPELAAKLRRLRNFGYETGKIRKTPHNVPMCWGTNAKLSEVHAAMALSNLKMFPGILRHHRAAWNTYRQHLTTKIISPLPGVISNYSYVVIQVPGSKRDAILSFLENKGCFARKYFDPPCHKIPPYSLLPSQPRLPETGRLCGSLIQLPTGLAIQEEDVVKISNWVNEALNTS